MGGPGYIGRREVPILHPAGNGCKVLPVALAAGEGAEEDQAQRTAQAQGTPFTRGGWGLMALGLLWP